MRKIEIVGTMVTFSSESGYRVAPGGKRKGIAEFSRAARLRMLKFLHSIDFDGCTLITLTYPNVYPLDATRYHDDLRAMRGVIEESLGKLPMIWKLEFQKRGAPHFHIVVLKEVRVNIKYLSAMWYKIVGSGDENHKKCGFDVKTAKGRSGGKNVGAYVCKYISKETSVDDTGVKWLTGRFWGHWNVKKPVVTEVEVTTMETIEAINAIEKYMGVARMGKDQANMRLRGTLFVASAGNVGTCSEMYRIISESVVELRRKSEIRRSDIESISDECDDVPF